MHTIGVIPARYEATRFPGKVLALIHGRPMIEYVWRQAKKSRLLEEVMIAGDDERVLKAAQKFQARAVMTAKDHDSGTDRIAEAVANISVEIVVNIQGDEPLIEPQVIDDLVKALLSDPSLPMATVIKRLDREEDLHNPNVVKALIDQKHNALYFSRSPIPFNRADRLPSGEKKPFSDGIYYKHLGLYAYRKDFLLKFKTLPPSRLEQTEKLEQLRVLDAGYKIRTVETQFETIGVDTPEDLARVEKRIKNFG